mmetsp:Transcript_22965/g.38441  ORF Transcript_22965/g.38441 Transcript_22965/m.38441 type:complete len:283 (+) Transcript_22965:1165-2013(+)
MMWSTRWNCSSARSSTSCFSCVSKLNTFDSNRCPSDDTSISVFCSWSTASMSSDVFVIPSPRMIALFCANWVSSMACASSQVTGVSSSASLLASGSYFWMMAMTSAGEVRYLMDAINSPCSVSCVALISLMFSRICVFQWSMRFNISSSSLTAVSCVSCLASLRTVSTRSLVLLNDDLVPSFTCSKSSSSSPCRFWMVEKRLSVPCSTSRMCSTCAGSFLMVTGRSRPSSSTTCMNSLPIFMLFSSKRLCSLPDSVLVSFSRSTCSSIFSLRVWILASNPMR